jgi:Flp pilus assembly protein TadD
MPGVRSTGGRPLYAETFVPRLHYGWSELRSLTRWPHKLVAAPRPELYDLAKDPREAENLYEKVPVVARALASELESVAGPPASPGSVDPETAERLKALGYAGSTATAAGELPDPKDRLEIYRVLNDPAIQTLTPSDGASFEKGLADLKDVLDREPRIPRTYALYGERLLEANRAAEAVSVFEKLATLDPGSFNGHYGLGVALQHLERNEAAVEAFERALRLDPRSTKTYMRLAEVDPGNAESWLRQALSVHEDRVLVDRLAEVLASTGRAPEAIALLEELAREHPGDPLAAYNLGRVLLLAGQTDRALGELQRSRELSPGDADVHQALGSALALSGRREEAVASFRKAVELSPCLAPALANLGAAYAELRRLPEAMAMLERAVACDPSYVAGFKNLAAIRLQMGNLEGATAALRSAVRVAPSDEELRAALQELLRLQR